MGHGQRNFLSDLLRQAAALALLTAEQAEKILTDLDAAAEADPAAARKVASQTIDDLKKAIANARDKAEDTCFDGQTVEFEGVTYVITKPTTGRWAGYTFANLASDKYARVPMGTQTAVLVKAAGEAEAKLAEAREEKAAKAAREIALAEAEETAPEGVHLIGSVYVRIRTQSEYTHDGKQVQVFNFDTQSWEKGDREYLLWASENTLLSAEQMKEFGDLYGSCVFCGRQLTDDASIAVGYGPKCAEDRGLPHGGYTQTPQDVEVPVAVLVDATVADLVREVGDCFVVGPEELDATRLAAAKALANKLFFFDLINGVTPIIQTFFDGENEDVSDEQIRAYVRSAGLDPNQTLRDVVDNGPRRSVVEVTVGGVTYRVDVATAKEVQALLDERGEVA